MSYSLWKPKSQVLLDQLSTIFDWSRTVPVSYPPHVLATVIYAIVTSRLDYCDLPYARLPLKLLQNLQLVQYSCMCPQPMLYQLHCLPVEYQIRIKVLTLTFKALCDLEQYICNTISSNMSLEELLSVHTNSFWWSKPKEHSSISTRTPQPFWLWLQPDMRSGPWGTCFNFSGPAKWRCSTMPLVEAASV